MKKKRIILASLLSIFTLTIAVSALFVLRVRTNEVDFREDRLTTREVDVKDNTEADKVIQDTVFEPMKGYTKQTELLEITNDSENFLVNGDIVAEEIRIKPKTALSVEVRNNSDFPTTIHFHGINADSNMDGVAGLTQEPIQPGETFTYKFNIVDKGTYMYHAHLDSANQVNNENLYGGLVVEDERMTNSDMLIYNTNINDIDQQRNAALTYRDIFVNGKSRSSLNIDNDENIYLNLVNLSSAPISINFGEGIKYRITSIDANPAKGDWLSDDSLIVPTAQRFIVEIENPKQSFQISTSLKNKVNARYDVIYKGDKGKTDTDFSEPVSGSMMRNSEYDNLASDGKMIYDQVKTDTGLDLASKSVDLETKMELSRRRNMWVINDKAFPDAKSINVNEGDVVEAVLTNAGHMAETHPFHLHGHKFQVIEVNGQRLDEELVLDTIDVLPGYEVKIRWVADNPGIWAFHCHNLTHAAKGMMTTLNYNGYSTNVQIASAE